MNRIIILLIGILTIGASTFAQTQSATYLKYIEEYRSMAIEQQIKHRIPAAITMAQGILESAAGQSELALKANNHFGIKCGSDWVGLSYSFDDDSKNECFRKYATPADSYEDHSLFLKRTRYASLFELPIADYKSWAHGLKACGYATDPKYADKLISLIERYNLQSLTLDSTLQKAGLVSEKDTTWQLNGSQRVIDFLDESYDMNESIEAHTNLQSKRINGVRYVVAKDGDTFASVALYLNMYERTLRKYNDALDGKYKDELQPGDIVYIYPKKNKASRKNAYYNFKQGDDIWKVSQKYGVKLRSIFKHNGIAYGTKMTTTQRIELR